MYNKMCIVGLRRTCFMQLIKVWVSFEHWTNVSLTQLTAVQQISLPHNRWSIILQRDILWTKLSPHMRTILSICGDSHSYYDKVIHLFIQTPIPTDTCRPFIASWPGCPVVSTDWWLISLRCCQVVLQQPQNVIVAMNCRHTDTCPVSCGAGMVWINMDFSLSWMACSVLLLMLLDKYRCST